MIAIIGIAGESIHDFMRFPESQRREAWAWLGSQERKILALNPARATVVTRLVSDEEWVTEYAAEVDAQLNAMKDIVSELKRTKDVVSADIKRWRNSRRPLRRKET